MKVVDPVQIGNGVFDSLAGWSDAPGYPRRVDLIVFGRRHDGVILVGGVDVDFGDIVLIARFQVDLYNGGLGPEVRNIWTLVD